MSVKTYFKKTFDGWVRSRQINVCNQMLGMYSLGPTHRKEVEQIYTRLLSEQARYR
jgi:hypothetical protein